MLAETWPRQDAAGAVRRASPTCRGAGHGSTTGPRRSSASARPARAHLSRADRTRDDVDVTLTTYAILRLDDEILAAHPWDTVVLDEAQNIKNADSQVARAAFALKARFRMTLTGTPVENRLDELWSQFHFANPGLLGGRSDFQDRYSKPISEGDMQVLQHLRKRIKPFMLRREAATSMRAPPHTDVGCSCR